MHDVSCCTGAYITLSKRGSGDFSDYFLTNMEYKEGGTTGAIALPPSRFIYATELLHIFLIKMVHVRNMHGRNSFNSDCKMFLTRCNKVILPVIHDYSHTVPPKSNP